MTNRPNIDPEFRDFFPPLDEHGYEVLAAKILEEGFNEPLVVWEEMNILVDGHNRLRICDQHGITPTIRYQKFENREQVLQWIRNHQCSRRNLPPDQLAYWRGKQYIAARKATGIHTGEGSVAEKIGEQHGVSGRTIQRDAEFAEALDKAPEKKQEMHNGVPIRRVAVIPKKRGTSKFDWQQAESQLGYVIRMAGKIADVFPEEKESSDYRGFNRLTSELAEVLKAWKKRIGRSDSVSPHNQEESR